MLVSGGLIFRGLICRGLIFEILGYIYIWLFFGILVWLDYCFKVALLFKFCNYDPLELLNKSADGCKEGYITAGFNSDQVCSKLLDQYILSNYTLIAQRQL